ncbi:MAG TPA: carboxypeptidase-like regulatory domain-containing protein [Pyrinomonadaceae bacterium]|nr:carboxypeptidase-like regulatory domain-containing protein [Pyrinomonadaceae bacterium]
MGILKLIAASFLLITSCTVLCAQQPAPTPKKMDGPVANGVIEGRVVNDSGQAMSGATVFVRAANSGAGGRTTTADSEGNFRLSSLEPALYTVSAVAPAYTMVVSSADPFTPTYYRLGDTVRIEMVRGGAITGTVTNALGEPVVAVRVRATMIRDARGEGAKQLAYITSEQPTDDRGIYRIYGLRPGTYIVSAGGSGFAYAFNPYDQDLPTFAPSSTRDTAAEVLVRSGEDSTIDIRYRGEPGHVISGTVKVAGTNGSSVALAQAGSAVPVGNTYQPDGARGFTFTGLGDGDYDIVAQELASNPNSTTTPAFSVSEPKRISLRGADVTGVEISTKPLSSISGKIALEPSKAPECQGKRPPLFAEMLVRLQKPEAEKDKEDMLTLRFLATSASPDANGAFQLRNLVPGKYQFEPRFYARYWYVESIATTTGTPKPQKFDAAANWMTVKSGEQLSNLTITLAQGAASIRGRVVVQEDAPVSAMSLYLVPAEPDKTNDVLRYFVSEVAEDMTFTFNNLPPGRFLTYLDSQTTTLKKFRQPEAAPERLKVRRNAETKKNEIELKPCQNLTEYQLKQ